MEFLRSVFSESKAREQSRAGKMQQSQQQQVRFVFLGCPIVFDVFRFHFSSLLFQSCSDFGYPFLITKWCFKKKHQNRNFEFLTCQKPHTSSSYPIIASKNDKHVRPYLSELTITHFHPTSTFGKRKGQETRLFSPGSLSLLLIAARNTKSGPKSVG